MLPSNFLNKPIIDVIISSNFCVSPRPVSRQPGFVIFADPTAFSGRNLFSQERFSRFEGDFLFFDEPTGLIVSCKDFPAQNILVFRLFAEHQADGCSRFVPEKHPDLERVAGQGALPHPVLKTANDIVAA